MNVEKLSEKKIKPDSSLYLTPGRKLQVIGSQDGSFKPFGHHIENEMGGIWMHPIKLLDGFWLTLKEENGDWCFVKDATEFTNYAFHNELTFQQENYELIRKQITLQNEAGLLIHFTIKNKSQERLKLSGNLSFTTDLMPVWYSEEGGIIDGNDELIVEDNQFFAKDSQNDWFAGIILENTLEPQAQLYNTSQGYDETFGKGKSGGWSFFLEVPENGTSTFCLKVSGSLVSFEQVKTRLAAITDFQTIYLEKQKCYQKLFDRSALSIPDKELEERFYWNKAHVEWQTIESEPVGTGLVAGIPEYVWFFGCDSIYALKGCIPAGFHELAEQTIEIIMAGSRRTNGNGRIIHEENTYGVVGNPGNTQETALYIHGLYYLYTWTGNKEWLGRYYQDVKDGIHWLLNEKDKDGDLFPEGYGIIEVLGLDGELVDTAVYTQVALDNAAKIAHLFDEDELANDWQAKSELLKTRINDELWLDDQKLYADVRIPGQELYPRLDKFIYQAKLHKDDHLIEFYEDIKTKLQADSLDQSEQDTAWCFKNWVINTPLEMGIATPESAEASLERLNSNEFIGEYGMYLSGDAQTQIMTISTSVQIQANLRYGKADEALALIKKISKTFNKYLPGSISEVSPDYGCFVQAWTSYGFISPFIDGFSGIIPDTANKTITINPTLPSEWDEITIENVVFGNASMSFTIKKQTNDYTILVSGDTQGWDFISKNNLHILK